jgi:carbonic anhydrase
MTTKLIHPESCTCCGDLLRGVFSRRHFIRGTAASAAALALAPQFALAATGNYEAMVLSCMDPRTQEPMHRYTTRRRLKGKFSQVILAGASIAVVAPAFKDWHKAFWDNLGASVQLHNIKRIVVINHRDCGAAKIAYGESAVATRDAETKIHRDALAEFRKQCGEKQPKLAIETGLMSLNGRIEMFS